MIDAWGLFIRGQQEVPLLRISRQARPADLLRKSPECPPVVAMRLPIAREFGGAQLLRSRKWLI